MDITIDVGGSSHRISRDLIVNGPASKLKEIILKETHNSIFFFDRPRSCFKAVISYYQTGSLHLPVNVCPMAFKDELKYWDISENVLAKCCFFKYKNFLNDYKNLVGFTASLNRKENILDMKRRTSFSGNVCSKIWNVLENQDHSLVAKIYYVVSMMLVLASIISIVISTIPSIKFVQEHNENGTEIRVITEQEDSSGTRECSEREELIIKCHQCFKLSPEVYGTRYPGDCPDYFLYLKEYCLRDYLNHNFISPTCVASAENIDCKLCYTTHFIQFSGNSLQKKCDQSMQNLILCHQHEFADHPTLIEPVPEYPGGITSLPRCSLMEELKLQCQKCFVSHDDISTFSNPQNCKMYQVYLQHVCYNDYTNSKIIIIPTICDRSGDPIDCRLCYITKFIPFTNGVSEDMCELSMEVIKNDCYDSINKTKEMNYTYSTLVQSLDIPTLKFDEKNELPATSGLPVDPNMEMKPELTVEPAKPAELDLSVETKLPLQTKFSIGREFTSDPKLSPVLPTELGLSEETELPVHPGIGSESPDLISTAKPGLPAEPHLIVETESPLQQRLPEGSKLSAGRSETEFTLKAEIPDASEIITESGLHTGKVSPVDSNLLSEKCRHLGRFVTCALCLINPLMFSPSADNSLCRKVMKTLLKQCFSKTMADINSTDKPMPYCSIPECENCILYPPPFDNRDCVGISLILLTGCYDNLITATEGDRESESGWNSKSGRYDNTTTDFNSMTLFVNISSQNVTTNTNSTDTFLTKKGFEKTVIEPGIDKFATLTNIISNDLSVFMYIEYIINSFLFVELLLRFITCPTWRYFFTSLLNWIDIFVLITGCGRFAFYYIGLEDNDALLYLQMIRILRLLRITENLSAFKILSYAIKESLKDMVYMSMYLFIALMVFSTLIYFFEKNEDFPSILSSCWWCIVTMTTVGYGDMYPKTNIGRAIGGVTAVSGVIIFSMIIPVIVQTFLSVYQYASLLENVAVTEKEPNCETKMKVNESYFAKEEHLYEDVPVERHNRSEMNLKIIEVKL